MISTRYLQCVRYLMAMAVIGPWSLAIGESNRQPPALQFRLGEFQSEIPRLSEPTAVALDDDNLLYIAQAGAARVIVVDREGTAVRSFGRFGEDGDEFLWPSGLAVWGDEVFVLDAGRHSVRVFTREGELRQFWGRHGAEPSQFNRPLGIAVRDDTVAVADTGNDRVQVFDRHGNLQFTIGRRGSAAGEFMRPLAVAIDAQHFIYVADADNNRIQKFDREGTFVKTWGEWGPFPGMLDEPSGLVIGDSNATPPTTTHQSPTNLFVVDRRNHRVQVFNADGTFVEEWGVHELIPHEGKGRLHYPDGIAIASDGSFAVIVESIEDRCQIFAPRQPDEQPPPRPFFDKANITHFGHHLSIDGNLMVIAEPENHFVFVFNILPPAHGGGIGEVPVIISQFGERGDRFGLLMRAAGIDLDFNNRTILLSDTATDRLQRYRFEYDPAGTLRFNPDMVTFADGWDLQRLQPQNAVWPIEASGIKRDSQGHLYVIDARNDQIHVYDQALKFIRSIGGGAGAQPGYFNRPTDLAFSRDGRTMYVVDSINRRVQAFDRDTGEFRFMFGKHGSGSGGDQFISPAGITTGQDGHLYITDAGAGRVKKYDASGTFLAEWGRMGARMGEMWRPQGIAQSEDGRVFVIDYGNHRGQIFAADGEWLVTFGAGRAYTRTRPPREE